MFPDAAPEARMAETERTMYTDARVPQWQDAMERPWMCS